MPPFMEVTLFVLVVAAALMPLRSSWGLCAVVVVLAAAGATAWSGRAPVAGSAEDPYTERRPLEVREGGFVSSKSCRGCHPREYDTWHASFHRTMTQVVTPETVISDWDGTQLEWGGRTWRYSREQDRYYIDEIDGEKRTRHRAVVSTGANHQQLYWFSTGKGRELTLSPFSWLVAEQRWIPYEHSFLGPPAPVLPVWSQCIKCHSTAYRPGQDPETGVLDTKVAELGIACEACHGPGEEHVRLNRDPLRRYALYLGEGGDPSIVHPARVSARRSAQICGQCHSASQPKTQALTQSWMQTGTPYRAGDDLEETHTIIRRPKGMSGSRDPYDIFNSTFWRDGVVRVSGRDYNGTADSPCYKGGEFSCLSCHSMHQSDPVDQLARGMQGDQACLQCHSDFRKRIAQHSHHAADSSGARCYNCHMPHTSYGLYKALRSHTVGSPSIEESVRYGRPNACNLCHLDKSLGWTRQHLQKWYPTPQRTIRSAEERERSAAALWLLRGDAGQRGLAVWHMGWEPALEVSGRDWVAPFLGIALDDPYAAVRFMAYRSLKRLPAFKDFDYDYLGTPQARARALDRALATWSEQSREQGRREIYQSPDGTLDQAAVDEVRKRRDNRPVVLAE